MATNGNTSGPNETRRGTPVHQSTGGLLGGFLGSLRQLWGQYAPGTVPNRQDVRVNPAPSPYAGPVTNPIPTTNVSVGHPNHTKRSS